MTTAATASTTRPWCNPALPRAWLSRLEDATLNASAPPQQRWLDGWLLRFSPGKAQRARSVNAVAPGFALSLPERIAASGRAYAAAGLPLLFRITPFSQPPELDASLQAAGFAQDGDSLVLACPALPAAPPAWPRGWHLAPAGPVEYAATVSAFRGSSATEQAALAERLANSPVPYAGWVVRNAQDEAPIACAQVAVEDGKAGLYDVFTAPAARGQGLARLLCQQLLATAAAHGATTGYLQVDAHNTAARRVYAQLGFLDGYAYHYRHAPNRP